MIQFIPDVFEIFQSPSHFNGFSVDLPFPVHREANFCISDFLPSFFLVARWFFSIPGPDSRLKKKRHAACFEPPRSSKCFLIFCQVELQFVEHIETNHQPMMSISNMLHVGESTWKWWEPTWLVRPPTHGLQKNSVAMSGTSHSELVLQGCWEDWCKLLTVSHMQTSFTVVREHVLSKCYMWLWLSMTHVSLVQNFITFWNISLIIVDDFFLKRWLAQPSTSI